jgi:single-strand DNA-binding protein
MFKLEGTLKLANETQVISEKFSKREFVIETQDQYPQLIMFQATQEKCNLLDGIGVGSKLEVSFNLRGREWTSPAGEIKYFNTLEAWKIDVLYTVHPFKVIDKTESDKVSNSNLTPANEEESDLPF